MKLNPPKVENRNETLTYGKLFPDTWNCACFCLVTTESLICISSRSIMSEYQASLLARMPHANTYADPTTSRPLAYNTRGI